MYSLDMQNPKGHCHPGSVSDLNDHGFKDIEDQLVKVTAEFINSDLKDTL